MTKFWRLAWNLSNTKEKHQVFRREIFWMPQQRPIHEPVDDVITNDVTTLFSTGKTIAQQEFVDFTKHSQYPNPPPRNGILPSGLDRFVVLAGYKALHDRAKELCTRYGNYRPGPRGQHPPVHNILLSGAPGIGELLRLNHKWLVTIINVCFALRDSRRVAVIFVPSLEHTCGNLLRS